MKIQRGAGFTLIELIITIAIFSIVLALGTGSYTTLIANKRLKNAAETLYTDLQLARMEAIKRSTTIYVQFNKKNQWCYGLDDEDGACDCTKPVGAGNCEIGEDDGVAGNEYSHAVNGGDFADIAIDENFGSHTTSFSPVRGTADNGHVTFEAANANPIRVILSDIGRVRLLCSDSQGKYSSC
ncbi:MAG: hypothetical protein A2V90_03070 [Gammaproteobacteria bacterium RBG_16_57_12]|nr:MAG: hypothetical protein A2V90_03070 [Gammaproteobacteria bacterium RBG_16_57_12]